MAQSYSSHVTVVTLPERTLRGSARRNQTPNEVFTQSTPHPKFVDLTTLRVVKSTNFGLVVPLVGLSAYAEVLEGNTAVDRNVSWEAKDTIADDVALNFVGAASDRR
jgi:hypothetical protein